MIPQSRFERLFVLPMTFGVRAVVVVASLALWCFLVLPVWLLIVMRTMIGLSFKTVSSVWRGAGTADVARLEDVVAFWPRGCAVIFRILFEDYQPADPRPRHPLEAVQETFLAAFFCTVLIANVTIVGDAAHVLSNLADATVPSLKTLIVNIVNGVPMFTPRQF